MNSFSVESVEGEIVRVGLDIVEAMRLLRRLSNGHVVVRRSDRSVMAFRVSPFDRSTAPKIWRHNDRIADQKRRLAEQEMEAA